MKRSLIQILAHAASRWLACAWLVAMGWAGMQQLQGQRIAPVGGWTAYPSHNTPKQLVKIGNTFLAITKGGLFSYDLTTKQTKSYTTVEGMSQVDPTSLYHDARSGKVFMGYSDGMIDVFTNPDEGFGYISDIQRSLQYTTKSINKMVSFEELLYIGTEFGIVVFDIDRNETRATVTKFGSTATGVPVRDVLIMGDSLYAALGDHGIWRAGLHHPNITLPSAWEEVTGHAGLSRGNCRMMGKSTLARYIQIGDTIFTRPGDSGPWTYGPMPLQHWTNMRGWDDYFYLIYSTVLRVVPPSGIQQLVFTRGNLYSAYVDSALVMVGDTVNGLSIWLGKTDSLEWRLGHWPWQPLRGACTRRSKPTW